MEFNTIVTDLTIELELSTKNESISLVNEITRLITATDSEIVEIDTNIFDNNKFIFSKKGIPIVLLSHGNFIKNEYPNCHVKKWHTSIEFTELEQCKISHPLLLELTKLFKSYKLTYKLTKITFATDIGASSDAYIVREKRKHLVKNTVVFIEDRYNQVVWQETFNNYLRLFTTIENRLIAQDSLILNPIDHNLKFQLTDRKDLISLDLEYVNNVIKTLYA